MKDHLAASNDFVRLSAQAAHLLRLQAILDTHLPAHLLPGTRVANFKRGKIVIHAASGAVAVKLRQLTPRLAEGFLQQGQELTGIDVRVQAHRPQVRQSKKVPLRVLGSKPKQALTSLADGLAEDSPLAKAIRKLVSNT